MKKVLLVLPVLFAIALTACNGGENNGNGKSSITSVTVKPAKYSLAIGAQFTLTAVATPAGEKGEYTWSSSDTLIAKVDQEGTVTGISAGTAYITATEKGGQSGQSEIRVVSYLESFSFGQVFMWNFNLADTLTAKIEDVTSSTGETYKAYKLPIDFMVFSEGFYLSDDLSFAGAQEGVIITMPSYFYWASQYLNDGKGGSRYVLGYWGVVDGYDKEDYTMMGDKGVYTDATLANVLKVVDAYNEGNYTDAGAYLKLAGESVTGTKLSVKRYSCSQQDPTQCGYSSNYIPDAIIEQAVFYVTNGTGSSKWMNAMPYCAFKFRELKNDDDWSNYIFGLEASYDEESQKIVVSDRSKLQVSEPIIVQYGTKPSNVNFNELIELPETAFPTEEQQANLKRQIEEGNYRVVNIYDLMHN